MFLDTIILLVRNKYWPQANLYVTKENKDFKKTVKLRAWLGRLCPRYSRCSDYDPISLVFLFSICGLPLLLIPLRYLEIFPFYVHTIGGYMLIIHVVLIFSILSTLFGSFDILDPICEFHMEKELSPFYVHTIGGYMLIMWHV